MQESTLSTAQTTPDIDSYTVQRQTSWCANRNYKQCAQECVGQHHQASRRASSTQACPCDSGRLVMQLHEAQYRYGQLRGRDTRHCAVRLYTRNGGGHRIDTRKRKNREAMCLECACHKSSRTPMSAQSVTRNAGSGTTVYQCCTWSQSVQDCASCVSSSRNSNRTTLWTRAKTKAQIWAKGTTERACLLVKKKPG